MLFCSVLIKASGFDSDSETSLSDVVQLRPGALGAGRSSFIAPVVSAVHVLAVQHDGADASGYKGSDEERAASFMTLISSRVASSKVPEACVVYRGYLNAKGPDELLGQEGGIVITYAS